LSRRSRGLPSGRLVTYDRGPDRRPDISLNGDDDDTAEAIGEVLDADAMDDTRDADADLDDKMAALSALPSDYPRESYAAFLHDW
jgi:hypothetical protein